MRRGRENRRSESNVECLRESMHNVILCGLQVFVRHKFQFPFEQGDDLLKVGSGSLWYHDWHWNWPKMVAAAWMS